MSNTQSARRHHKKIKGNITDTVKAKDSTKKDNKHQITQKMKKGYYVTDQQRLTGT